MIRRIPPMKINKIPQGKEHLLPSLCASGEYFAELKKDGYWYEFEKSDEGNFLFSATVSAITGELCEKSANVPHIITALDVLPQDTVLVGEIYYPGGTSKDVTPIMGSLPDKAVERQKNGFGWLHYYIHDVLIYNGIDLRPHTHWVRYKILEAIWNKYNLLHATPQGICLELAEAVETDIFDAINAALAAGEEGMVLKKRNAFYHQGSRSPVWDTIKVKKTDTCDAVITGFNAPTKYYNGKLDVRCNYQGIDAGSWPFWVVEKSSSIGLHEWSDYEKVPVGDNIIYKGINFRTMPVTKAYYYGWITSINVGAYQNDTLVNIGSVSSGLTDELEEDMARNPDKYLGKVCELAGMEKNYEDHTLRHFFFKRLRDDKLASECTIKEIF